MIELPIQEVGMNTSATAAPTRVQTRRRRTFLAGGLAAGCLLVTTGISAAEAGTLTYDYLVSGVVHETHVATGVDGDVGLCAAQEAAEFDGAFTFRLRSTVGGLSDADVLAVRDSEPVADGTVVSASMEQAGTLVQRSGGHLYSMRYTSRDTLRVHDNRISLAGSFIAVGTSERRTPYSIHQSGWMILVDGAPRLDRSQLRVRGCLP
jgi:hypothetical protein